MSITLNKIITGMDQGPEKIHQNFNAVKNELDRQNGSVIEIPKAQFTVMNGFSIDTDKGTIFKFDSFAIVHLKTFVGNVNLKGWTYKEAVSLPKSYFNGFTKFSHLGSNRRTNDSSWQYDVNFDITKGVISLYTRGNEYTNQGLDITITGILYN